jgi:hypothetical protein
VKMGKAADNERIKLRASFRNNLAVAFAVTGLVVPYFASFSHNDRINAFLMKLWTWNMHMADPDISDTMNIIVASAIALGAAVYLRKWADKEAAKIKE